MSRILSLLVAFSLLLTAPAYAGGPEEKPGMATAQKIRAVGEKYCPSKTEGERHFLCKSEFESLAVQVIATDARIHLSLLTALLGNGKAAYEILDSVQKDVEKMEARLASLLKKYGKK